MAASRLDLFYAWLVATLLSGLPSTTHALLTGGDPFEATRAAGAMLISASASPLALFAAAAIVHSVVSLLWTVLFGLFLPERHVLPWALMGSSLVAWLDLQLIAPLFFPSVAALPFWPQFADHLMWGLCLGTVLWWRRERLPDMPVVE
jgi:hypothetical protein